MSDIEIAQARVVVRPDTTRFRADLDAQLRTAVSRPIPVPVTLVPTGTTAGATAALAAANQEATAATLGLADAITVENQALAQGAVLLERDAILAAEDAAAQQQAGASKTFSAKASRELAAAQALGLRTAQALALSQAEVATAASAVSAAQTQAARAGAAVALAERAVGAALTAGNIALIDAASNSLSLARAREAEAIATLQATRAEAAHSASLANVNRAAIASGAGLLGLRGAVLTAGAAFLGATVAFQALGKAISSAADFETQLNVFQQTARATDLQLEQVSQTSRQLGADITLPAVSAGDAAEAMTLLAKAGLDVQDSLEGARGVLQLATAAQISNAEAAEFTANALNAFQLEGAQATHVADLLTASAQASQGSISDIGIAFQQVAGAVAPLGVSLEDTIALLTQLARGGLQGSDAGTALRVAILNLVSPTQRARKELEGLGIDIRNARGEFRPEAIIEFADAIRDLDIAEQNRLSRLVFGQSAIRAFNLIQREGLQGLEDARQATNQVGAAQEAAAARTKGFSGDVEALSSNLETLGTTLGAVVTPALGGFFRGLNLGVGLLNRTADAIRDLSSAAPPAGASIEELDAALAKTLEDMRRLRDSGGIIPPGLTNQFADLSDQIAQARGQIQGADEDSHNMAIAFRDAAAGARDLTAAVGETGTTVLSLGAQIEVAEAQGAGDQELLRLLRKRQQRQQDFLDRQLTLPFTDAREKLVIEASNNLEATNNRIQAILDGQAADAKEAAAKREKTLKDIQDSFVQGLAIRRDEAQNRIALAQATQGTADDIRAQNAFTALIRRQIEAVRREIKDQQERRAVIAQLTSVLIQSRQAAAQLREQRRQELREAAEARVEQRQRALELNVEFGEITENEAKQRQALQKLIQFLERRIRAMKGISNKERELRNELARRRKQLEELTTEQKKNNNAMKELQFQFLQTQAGFAANLIGNLIPGFATSGLLAGPIQPVTTADVPPGIAQGRETSQANQIRPVSSGQGNAQIDLLRKILTELRRSNRGSDHPEAKQQRRTGATAGDFGGGTSMGM